MAILKNEIKEKFTMIPNYILYQDNISLKAIGMYCKMLALPNNWKFTESGLASIVKDGRDSARTAITELEELGLLYRFQIRDNGKMGEMIYYLSEIPLNEEDKKQIEANFNPIELINTDYEKPLLEEPKLEIPTTENTHNIIYNNKKLNKYNTDNICIKEKNEKPQKHKYGEYGNVLLTDEQYEKLKTEFPNDYEKRIENTDVYVQSTGKKYKDYLATIRNWARKEKKVSKISKYEEEAKNETW